MRTHDFYTKTVMIILLFALLFSSCGTHPAPDGGEPRRADFDDFVAYAFGWQSWEQMTGDQGGMVIATTSEGAPTEVVLAFPQALVVGSMGDKILSGMYQADAAQAIGPGEAYAARLQTSLYAIQQAFSSNPNAKMYLDASGRWVAAFLPNGQAWYMGFVDLQTKSMFQFCQQLQNCGSFVNWQSASEITSRMKELGWTAVTAKQIPAGVRSYFLYRMAWLREAWFVRLQGVMASPLFVVGGSFNIPHTILLPHTIAIEQPEQ